MVLLSLSLSLSLSLKFLFVNFLFFSLSNFKTNPHLFQGPNTDLINEYKQTVLDQIIAIDRRESIVIVTTFSANEPKPAYYNPPEGDLAYDENDEMNGFVVINIYKYLFIL